MTKRQNHKKTTMHRAGRTVSSGIFLLAGIIIINAACASESTPSDLVTENDITGDPDAMDTEADIPADHRDTGQDPAGDDGPSDVEPDGDGPDERCGDGVVQSELGEECDDGDDNSDTDPDACRTDCVLPSCGDGVTDSGEECDDGNDVDNDECSNGCVEVIGDLCSPCTDDSQCGRDVDLCTEMPDGDFCTVDCSDGAGCPEGFECTEILSGDTVIAQQCLPLSGVCAPCYDPDEDGYGIGPDCLGPDCDESNDQVNSGAVEICDGIDNNCDGSEDEGFPLLGAACDGDDGDLCENGTYTCTADGSDVECVNEAVTDIPDICNGLDDDCDGSADEDFPLLGASCDGPDIDLCENGTYTCTADGSDVECVNETVENIPEICNGADDDCDGLTDAADAADLLANDSQLCENQHGVCAGCTKPVNLCSGGSWQICTDTHYASCSSYYEAGSETSCDLRDNDCDNTIDEMTDSDVNNCGHCGFVCILPNANPVCIGGNCRISSCHSGYSNCDASHVNGCEVNHDTNPPNITALYIGSVCGDQTATGPNRSDRVERWYWIEVEECDDIGWPSLEFYARLIPPAGTDWDLYLYSSDIAGNCGGLLDSSLLGTGMTDTVHHGPWGDNWGTDDTSYFCIEIRYYSGGSCSNWTLQTRGKTSW